MPRGWRGLDLRFTLGPWSDRALAAHRGAIAACVFWSAPASAVIGMSKVPCFVWPDGLSAPSAGDGASSHDGCELPASARMLRAVASGMGGWAGSFPSGGTLGAEAVRCGVRAAWGTADGHCSHRCSPALLLVSSRRASSRLSPPCRARRLGLRYVRGRRGEPRRVCGPMVWGGVCALSSRAPGCQGVQVTARMMGTSDPPAIGAGDEVGG